MPGLWAATHLKELFHIKRRGHPLPLCLSSLTSAHPFLRLCHCCLPCNFSSLRLHAHTFQTSVKLSDPKAISMPFYCLSLLSQSLVQILTLSRFHHVGRLLEYDGLSNSLQIRLSHGKKTLLLSECCVNTFSGFIPSLKQLNYTKAGILS